MKRTIYFGAILFSLLLTSCGPSEADIAKTCECEALFTKMKGVESEYMVGERISSSEAQKKVQAEFQEPYDKCIQLHKDMGDDNYFKASQKCGSK